MLAKLAMLAISVSEASGDVSSIAATSALTALAILLVVAALAAWRLTWPGREHSSATRFVAFASVALILSVTVFRDGLPVGFHLAGLADWSGEGLRRLSGDPLGSSQFLLNVLLFVPAGLAWTWVVNRPVAVFAALVGGSLLIECTQGTTGAGAADIADLVANGLGAAAGVGIAAAVARIGPRQAVVSRRTRVTAVSVTTTCVSLLVAGWFIGAARRQLSVEDRLRHRFSETSKGDIDRLLSNDPEAVWSAVAERADGIRYADDAIEIRYPATFFGLHRCVLVTWGAATLTFTKASGHDCTVFFG